MDLNTPIWQLTVGQFIELQNKVLEALPNAEGKKENGQKDDRHFVYGLAGLAELLNCSVVTARRIKSSGLIDGAVYQFGRKIIVDADKALNLLSEDKSKA